MITTSLSGIPDALGAPPLDTAREAHSALLRSGAGFLSLPHDMEAALGKIQDTAAKIRAGSEVFVVIGIGGSYLGAHAAIELLRSPFYNALPGRRGPEIYFAGNNVSGEYLEQLLTVIGGRDFSVNYVSKSGGTLEPSAAFRVFHRLLEAKYGAAGARGRIFVTTDPARGRLRAMARDAGYETFSIPPDVGGRYSVLSAVGLLPMAVAGCDIAAVLRGARAQAEGGAESVLKYAAARSLLYGAGKKIEIFTAFEPAARALGEWWKQLFGESEGKNGRGIFPAAVSYTADLHSLGQYVQEGERTLFETFVSFARPRARILVPGADLPDGLDALSGRPFAEVNAAAAAAVCQAHMDGGVPVVEITAPGIDAGAFGALTYFFETACAVSAGMLGVDPFDQPGVEAYKKELRGRLGLEGM